MVVTTDAPAEAVGLDAFFRRYKPGVVPNPIPRDDARRLHRVRSAALDPAAQAAALRESGPLALDADTVGAWFTNGSALVGWLLEADLGTTAVLDAALAFMTSRADDAWLFQATSAAAVRGLGAMLHRVPSAEHGRYVGALEAVFERTYDAHPLSQVGRALDVILHGRMGVERSGSGLRGTLFLAEYAWAVDDPMWVSDSVLARLAKVRPADREIFDPQVVVAGGAALIEAFRSSSARFQTEFRPDMTAYATLFRA
jgi:hypothetical protein